MSHKVCVIVEDQTDGDVIRVVLRRTVGNNAAVKIRSQKGCANIKAKAKRIIEDEYLRNGVSHIIVVRDLDRRPQANVLNDEAELRRSLTECCHTPDISVQKLICIPVEELEAWFWSDPEILKLVAGGKETKAHPEPHRIASPKEKLERLSRDKGGKPRYSTQDNRDLAEKLDLELCVNRCPSFKALIQFAKASFLTVPSSSG
jgi:hypothetical protein